MADHQPTTPGGTGRAAPVPHVAHGTHGQWVAHVPAAPHEGHASPGFYWMIGIVLAIITGIEVAVFYIPGLQSLLVPVLLTLSAAKFAMVVMFFMHLRFDSKIFTGVFVAGLFLATFMIGALIVLYHFLPEYQG